MGAVSLPGCLCKEHVRQHEHACFPEGAGLGLTKHSPPSPLSLQKLHTIHTKQASFASPRFPILSLSLRQCFLILLSPLSATCSCSRTCCTHWYSRVQMCASRCLLTAPATSCCARFVFSLGFSLCCGHCSTYMRVRVCSVLGCVCIGRANPCLFAPSGSCWHHCYPQPLHRPLRSESGSSHRAAGHSCCGAHSVRVAPPFCLLAPCNPPRPHSDPATFPPLYFTRTVGGTGRHAGVQPPVRGAAVPARDGDS